MTMAFERREAKDKERRAHHAKLLGFCCYILKFVDSDLIIYCKWYLFYKERGSKNSFDITNLIVIYFLMFMEYILTSKLNR